MSEREAKVWQALEVRAGPEAIEAVESALNALDPLGTSIDRLGARSEGPITITAYFDQRPDESEVAFLLGASLRSFGAPADTAIEWAWSVVPDTDWLAEWKKYWEPTVVGSFVVAPPWERLAEDKKHVIRIEPNMAFGTGTHPTTQLCLLSIERSLQPEDSFLDVGTGTGILAIAAAMLLRASNGRVCNASVRACDTDITSVEIAQRNAELNQVGGSIVFSEETIGSNTEPAEIVCANLTIDVIEPMIPLLVEKAKRVLILSGILVEQEQIAIAGLTRLGIERYEIERLGEWAAITAVIQPRDNSV